MNSPMFSVGIDIEHDVVAVRQHARQIATLLRFSLHDQARIATAASEVARNALAHKAGGRVEFSIDPAGKPALVISITEPGCHPGEPHAITSEADLGIDSASRLMDHCTIESSPAQGTKVTLRKNLPPDVRANQALLAHIDQQLAQAPGINTFAELQQQNTELTRVLAELKTRQEELLVLTQELEDTNRGVVALYAEIEDKANHLRRMDDMKTRLLSNTSHELRTPLVSIRGLARLLLDRVDGELTPEQEKQVAFIEQSATELSAMVNDLLDLAKIAAGKTEVTPSLFSIDELYSALRGMFRPVLDSSKVVLIFEEGGIDELFTDEAKLSQILRNFISNALKFTAEGEVRVTATAEDQGAQVRFSVSDTGIDIPDADTEVIFQEFSQLENPMQAQVKGTGLGLPMCRNLAVILNGKIEVQSTPGQGSMFSLIMPVKHAPKS